MRQFLKRVLKENDIVSWKSGRKTYYGRIMELQGNAAVIAMCTPSRWGDFCRVPKDLLNYEPPVILSREDLRKFSRFEIRYEELMQNRIFADFKAKEPYQIGPEDLKEAVLNFRRSGISEEDFGPAYFWPLHDELYEEVGLETAIFGPDNASREDMTVPNRYTVFWDAWDILVEKYEYGEEDVDPDEVITEIQTWEDNREKPYALREYTARQKKSFLDYWNDDRLAGSPDIVKTVYRKILDSLCEEEDVEALRTKAYACYGHGNAAYGQNWPESQKCLLRLMALAPDPETANTLGYMYYYGRCTDGVPEYDKAFYYFSIGAAGGYYESRYKLSDMFRHGYGTARNPRAAASLIWELYADQLEKICSGQFDSSFADVALRAGNLWKEGIDCPENPDHAYYFYLQAQYAIRMRMLAADRYGDQKVAAGIEEAIAEILPRTHFLKRKNTVQFSALEFLLQNGLEKMHRMEMKIRRVSGAQATLTFRIVPFENEAWAPKLFVTVPDVHFCGLLEKVTVRTRKLKTLDVPEGTDTVLFDSVTGGDFYLYGRKVAEIDADFIFTAPVSRGKKYSFASVTFQPGGKRYDYLCDLPLRPGDKAVVTTAKGESIVTVAAVFEKTEPELALPLKCYKKILRAAEE